MHYWVRRYLAQGVSGVLHDAPRPGRRKRTTREISGDHGDRDPDDEAASGDPVEYANDGP